mgnify:CR=1 FL=1
MSRNKKILLITLFVSLIVICIGTSIGSSNINIQDVISIILNKIFNIPLLNEIEERYVSIIWKLRLPRVLLAFLVGAALSVSGVVIQSILKNSLASPYTLGISSGASLGVGIVIVTGITFPILGVMMLPVVGFICGLITVFAVVIFSSRVDKTMGNNTLILAGMVFSLFSNAILTTITALCREKIESISLWQMGSFSLKGWSYVKGGIIFFIIGFIGVILYAKEMDILSFGEEQAKSIGVETEKVKKKLLFLVAILTGTSVALSGVIGFVDLIIPHLVRKIIGSKHIYVIPMALLLGGSFMVITDLIARTVVVPSELPVGAITALIGAPFFAYIYFKKSK